MGKVIYANSITLTPGTIAIDLIEDEIIVHALLSQGVEVLETGEMDRRVTLLER
jgi:multicomponent Na+:H+ antiporter subunit E